MGWAGIGMGEGSGAAVLRRIYGKAITLHHDLYEESERHRKDHGQGCTVFPQSPTNAPIWPLLTALVQARRFLEVGCGLGYSSALMAEAGGPNARVDTIEKRVEHADIAEEELKRRRLLGRVVVLRGDAVEILPTLREAYDVVFVDGDWEDYPALLDDLGRLTRPGGILLTSNLFPLFEEWASSLLHKERIEEYLSLLVRDSRFRTFVMRGEWKALSYRMPLG